jgi:hypothetical protein
MSNLNNLKYNLHEIHAAASLPGGELVSNFSETRVYLSTSGWGRLWTWFYNWKKLLFNDDIRLSKLRTTIQNIDEIFSEEPENVRVHAESYEEYLQLRLNSNDVEENDYHEARRGIMNWHQATKFYFKERNIVQQTDLCSKYLEVDEFLPFFSEVPDGYFSQLHHIIKMEGKFRGPLPLDLIQKGVTGQKMTKTETTNLLGWITQCRKVRSVHKLLTSISPFIDNPDVAKFELDCLKKQNTLFKEIDWKHIEWREKLQPGMQLGEYTLGEQVGGKTDSFDEQIFFEVEEDPSLLFMFSTNRSLLRTKEIWAPEGGWGLHTPVFHYIDPQEKYALIEKFEFPISEINWVSTLGIMPQDKQIANPIANFVKWLLNYDMSLSQLHPKYIMFDAEYVLRSVKIQERVPMNFPALEKFLVEAANGNLSVFQYLMDQSGLSRGKHAYFYRTAIKEALKNGSVPDTRDIGANIGIIDRRDLEMASELCNSILSIQNRCVANLQADRKLIGKIILTLIKKYETYSTIWPTIEYEIGATLQAIENKS